MMWLLVLGFVVSLMCVRTAASQGRIMWRQKNRWARCGSAILAGISIIILPALLLLFIYGMCLANPKSPDYYQLKVRMMFSLPDPGWVTLPCVAIVLLGVCVAAVGTGRALLGKPRDCLTSGTWREKVEAARGRFRDIARRAVEENGITPVSPGDAGWAAGILRSEANNTNPRHQAEDA